MNVGFVTVYGDAYTKDRLFDLRACKIGQNVLLPNILLKEQCEEKGIYCHTADMFEKEKIDLYFFQEIPRDSILTIQNFSQLFRYVYRRKWKRDYLLKAVRTKTKSLLQINEPPHVMPLSHNTKYHKFFNKVLTWSNDLVACDSNKYIHSMYPQPKPENLQAVPFHKKRIAVVMAGNKASSHKNSLYSKRREFIDYFDQVAPTFDLYGPGWETEHLSCYKGFSDDKLKTLSNYKYCICFENMRDLNGYITEKIFDCFFAGCIPVYWGAGNINAYIPANTFIDATKFSSPEEVYSYISSIDEAEYCEMLSAIRGYINSDSFESYFSVDTYVKRTLDVIVEVSGGC